MNENHRRGISVTLSMLDKALCEFDHWAKGCEVHSVLYEIRNTLSRSQCELIVAEVAVMKTKLREIRNELRLDASVRFVDKMILGSCSILWASLIDLEGRRLRRYGEVPPGLAEYLDPLAVALSRHVRNISDIVSGRGPR